MEKKRSLTLEDISRAKQLVKEFGGANLPRLERSSYEELIGIYYNKIRGVPLRDISDVQLYRIAQRLYNQAHEIVRQNREGTLEKGFSS